MWRKGWRDEIWSALDQQWDIIIIGGGVTGAGILREASRLGLRTLLLEAHDFSSGTSSRSSKLVHGGFRYLKNAQLKITLQSVRERERLLREGRGLINQLGFLMPIYSTDKYPAWLLGLGLTVYDMLALNWMHSYYAAQDLLELCPYLSESGLRGGYRFFDAQTDDARLVLRLIQESLNENCIAINYALVSEILRNKAGQVRGVVVRDLADESLSREAEVRADVVINAAGVWTDEVRTKLGLKPKLRKLRGSHLIFPFNRLPITRAVSFWHPTDRRPIFALPWEGVTILGTTDVEQSTPLPRDPRISTDEIEYLLHAAKTIFPQLDLTHKDIQTCFSGIRPVVDTGKTDPSKESREHILLCENGMVTITGGKLTTFRLMAREALQSACALLRKNIRVHISGSVLDMISLNELSNGHTLSPSTRMRLIGRYGSNTPELLEIAGNGEFEEVEGTKTLGVELRWAVLNEGIVHLEDLMLRRVRLGLVLPQGGHTILDQWRSLIQTELGWSDNRWKTEVFHYKQLWKCSYSSRL